jgi:hypothetical protein
MSPQLEASNGSEAARPDLIDRIANALPGELRADYYRELAHCRQLPENDEMLRILRAMQFLVVLIEQAPVRMAVEREHLAEVLGRAIESIRATHEAGVAYQKQLEIRITKLPDEIARDISAEAIAAKIGESLRQEFQRTGMPAVTEAIGAQGRNDAPRQQRTFRGARGICAPDEGRGAASEGNALVDESQSRERGRSHPDADERARQAAV